jgi:predicted SprT family Zn-dependent metalloprotease
LPEQLELRFANAENLTSILSLRERRTTKSPGEGSSIASLFGRNVAAEIVGQALRLPDSETATGAVALQRLGRDSTLEAKARELLIGLGASPIAAEISVEWSARLKTCAGRADYRRKLILLNPRLREHGFSEIDQTLRHELAHFLAQFCAGRRRILPHGQEWREACKDLGIGDEKRCHNLPFPTRTRARRFVYKCPNCLLDFPRVRRIKRAIACLACCRAHNRGRFHPKFRLQLLESTAT